MSSAKAAPAKKTNKIKFARNRECYDLLVQAYIGGPGNHSRAHRETGFDRKSCRYAWENGWEKWALPGCIPIREVVADERAAARAAARDRQKREAELVEAERARRDSALRQAMLEEASLLIETRSGVFRLADTVAKLAKVMPAFAKAVQDAVVDPATNQIRQTPLVTPIQASKILRDFSAIAHRTTYAAQVVFQLGKEDRGLTPPPKGVEEIEDPSELLEELSAAASLHDRLTSQVGPALEAIAEDDGDNGAAVH